MSELKLHNSPLLMDFVYLCQVMRDDERAQMSAFGDGSDYNPEDAALALAAKGGPKWGLYIEQGGELIPLAIGGFEPIGRGVYQDFMVGSELAWTQYWRTISKYSRRLLDTMLEQPGVRRVQCVALASRTDARKWYRVLGYELEGIMRSYGANGEDAAIYAKVRKG